MTSEEIILNAYKTGHLTLEESLQLLKDIKGCQPYIYPYYPQIIYSDKFTYNPNNWKVTSTTTHDDQL